MLSEQNFTIAGQYSVAYDFGDDKEFARRTAQLWSSIPPSLQLRTYLHRDKEFNVSADWGPLAFLTQEVYRIFQLSVAAEEKTGVFEWIEAYPNKVEIPVSVKFLVDHTSTSSDYSQLFFAESYLYDVFTIVNLALPGAADFLNLEVKKQGQDFVSDSPKLSAYYLHQAYTETSEWPAVEAIDLSMVEKWYSDVRVGTTQIPNSPIERAIFALLHICRSRGKPDDIIWLFYAFESLLETRVGENFTALVQRLALILRPNEDQLTKMRKRLRDMYSYRSAFVHGGLKVIHPLHNEILDPRVNDEYGSTIELSLYGTRLLIACLQVCIRENWSAIGFETALVPVPVHTAT